jgi:NYN domain
VDRCALFVDAGYVLADGAMAVHGTRHRESVSWNYGGLLQFLGTVACDRTGLPLLRCYWYEATVEGRRSAEHDALADLPGVKLRLGRMRPGRREGVESEIHRDLTTLARNGAIRDALVVSAEEDLAQVIADVQDLGLKITLVHITVDGNWTISRALRQECDDIVEIGEAHLRPYVELVVGAEPLRDDERRAAGSYSGRALTNGHGPVGSLGHQQALPAGSQSAPPEIYTAPVIAEYQRTAQPAMNGQPGAQQPANASGPIGMAPPAQQVPQPGQPQAPPAQQAPPPRQAQAPQPAQAQAAPAQAGQAPPAQQAPRPAQPQQVPRPGQPQPAAAAPGAAMQQGMAGVPGMQPAPGMAAQQGAPAAQQAMPAAQPVPGPAQTSGPMPAQPGMPQAATPAMAGQPGLPPAAPVQAPPAQQRVHNSGAIQAPAAMPQGQAAQPGQPAPPGPMVQQAAPGQPAMQPPPAQQGHPGMAPQQQPGPPGMQPGQTLYPAPPAYQGPGPDVPGAPGGQGQADPRQAMAGPQPSPALAAPPGMPGQPVPPGPVMPPAQQARGGARAYPAAAPTGPAPAPAGRFARGPQAPQPQPQQFAGPPGDQLDGGPGAGYAPQQQVPYGGPQPGAGHLVPQASVSLADAVQAAHGEGFNFGQSVAREAPVLWLEAVLARKPRMPSDLEARLLQDSALPIDSLLHDEVRHALRRGFWDALERARH